MKNSEQSVHEPLFHIVKRNTISTQKMVLIYAIAIAGGLLLSSIICASLSSKNIFDFFASIFSGCFKTQRKFWVLMQDMALLLGVSLALVPAFKMKFWNLGGNGQILVGNLAAIACIFYLGEKIPEWLLVILMFVAAITAGAVWAVIPAIFKALFDTNESLFTLMMNYIAKGLVAMFITIWVKSGSGILKQFEIGNIPQIPLKEGAIAKPFLLTVIVFILAAGVMYVYLRFSKHGYEVAVVGESHNTAKYIGINVKTVMIRTMIISGAICGLVGFFLAGSISHTVAPMSDNNMGFTAIMVAWLANFNPLVMILAAFFIEFVTKGMVQVRKDFGFTNDAASNIVVGILYFFIIAVSFFVNYRIVLRKGLFDCFKRKATSTEKEEEAK